MQVTSGTVVCTSPLKPILHTVSSSPFHTQNNARRRILTYGLATSRSLQPHSTLNPNPLVAASYRNEQFVGASAASPIDSNTHGYHCASPATPKCTPLFFTVLGYPVPWPPVSNSIPNLNVPMILPLSLSFVVVVAGATVSKSLNRQVGATMDEMVQLSAVGSGSLRA